MKKKGLPLVAGIILLILLVVLYIALVKQNEKASEESEDTIKVLDVTSEDVTSVKLLLDEKEETFSRQEGAWTLMSDADFNVDSAQLDSLVSSLTGLSASRLLKDVSDLTQYGLEQPSQTIVLTNGNGKEYTICFGDSNDVTGDQYLFIKEESSKVYTVDGNVSTSISNVLEDYKAAEEDTSENVENEN